MRIRTIKPEYWSSEQPMEMSIPARLLFIGMWNFCDDAGIHPASIKTLKAEVFPCDGIDVAPLVQEIIGQGLVLEYEVADKRYWYVTGWQRHQKIDRATFKHPLPDGTIPKEHNDIRRAFDEYSTNVRRALDPGREGSLKEGSRVERTVEEGNRLEEKEKKPLPPEALRLSGLMADLILANNPKHTELTEAKREATVARWAGDIDKLNRVDDQSWKDIEEVIRWCHGDSFWQGNILSGVKLRTQFNQLTVKMKDALERGQEECWKAQRNNPFFGAI